MPERTEPVQRRILVALDASSRRLATLEAAAQWAALLRAELHGLFVEDENLLRLAGLPFAREVAFCSATMRDLDLAAMERILRSQAEAVRNDLVEVAQRVRVRWSFQVARGHVARTSREAARDADLLIIGREAPGPHPLLPRHAPHADQPILVAYHDSPAGRRALEIAAELTPAAEDRVSVVVVADSPTRARTARSTCETWMRQHGLSASSCTDFTASSADDLLQAAGNCQARLLMIGSDNWLLDDQGLDLLLEGLDCPLALVR
ncbi:MAG: universal stress protein [Pirellulaceae bacterium]|nr:universal stress protein [Pirellulaceae bacterium]